VLCCGHSLFLSSGWLREYAARQALPINSLASWLFFFSERDACFAFSGLRCIVARQLFM
jgi:hypothetical protein